MRWEDDAGTPVAGWQYTEITRIPGVSAIAVSQGRHRRRGPRGPGWLRRWWRRLRQGI